MVQVREFLRSFVLTVAVFGGLACLAAPTLAPPPHMRIDDRASLDASQVTDLRTP